MVSKTIVITRTGTGTPAISAGGGAFHNTYQAVTVMSDTPTGYSLKTATFIKTSGHRASSLEQAIIPIEIGDVIVSLYGKLPITDQNPDAIITGYKITSIADLTATAEQIKITHREIPVNVITGASTYHNKEGSYFCDNIIVEPVQEG
jgi:hypothetical protein